MDILFRLDWEAVSGAVSYRISFADATGTGETVVTTTTSTYYDAAVDELIDKAFFVRSYDGTYYGTPVVIPYYAPLTRTKVRNMIREEFQDKDSTAYTWEDAELNQYIEAAIDKYAIHFPLKKELTLTTSLNVKTYKIYDTVVAVNRVEYIDDDNISRYLLYKPWKGGEELIADNDSYWKLGVYRNGPSRTRQFLGHYDFSKGNLLLDFNPSANESLVVRYASYYVKPRFDAVQLDIPEHDIELIVLYACGKAAVRVEKQDATLSRWDETGRRDDNPLIKLSTRYFNAFDQGVKDRLNKPHFMRRTRV